MMANQVSKVVLPNLPNRVHTVTNSVFIVTETAQVVYQMVADEQSEMMTVLLGSPPNSELKRINYNLSLVVR